MGRAIVREPAAFLFDEPLSNLDAKLRVTTRAELKRLHQRLKTTTIYVTHDQEEAMTLGDRIVCMKDGLIQQADTPLNTYNFPGQPVRGRVHRHAADELLRRGTIKPGRRPAGLSFEEGTAGKNATQGRAGPTPTELAVTVGELTLPGNGFRLSRPRSVDRVGDCQIAGRASTS